jgi:hypothetical protein
MFLLKNLNILSLSIIQLLQNLRKLQPSASTQADDLVQTIKKLREMKSDPGKLCEPEPFTGKDPRKLKAFIFQC